MCLLGLALDPHPKVRLVLAANRDEAHDRPTRALARWSDAPAVVGGRDLRAGGTWLGVTESGRLAAITNVRSLTARREGRSRGEIPRAFLEGSESPDDFVAALSARAAVYPSFNLVVGDAASLLYANELGAVARLDAGLHAVSNGRLDDPWPKASRIKSALADAVSAVGDVDVDALFTALGDVRPAADEELPRTGVPLELERLLAPPFVVGASYGTRSSAVVIIERAGAIRFEERSYDASGAPVGSAIISIGTSAH